MKKVSIIIPVYNVEQYLNRCLKSVINQTYKNIEIILVDDGSTDKSKQICDEFQEKDDRITTFHKSNGGLGDARNYGLNKCSGEYVIFLDSDDYIEIDTIEKMMLFSETYDIVCCGFDRISEKTLKVYSNEMTKMPFDEITISKDNVMETAFLSPSGWGKLFRRELLNGKKFSNNKKSIEDILFYLEIIPETNKIKFVKEILWHYMVRDNSLIMSIDEEKANLFEQELLKVKNKYSSKMYSQEFQNYLILQVLIHNCISIPSRLYNNETVDIKKRIIHIKRYMNENFENWQRIKININGRPIKKMALYFIRFLYKINMFTLFLFLYNFMINKLKIDIKW